MSPVIFFLFFSHTDQVSWSEGGKMMNIGIDKVDWVWVAMTVTGFRWKLYRQDGMKISKGDCWYIIALVPFGQVQTRSGRVGAGTFQYQGEFLVDWYLREDLKQMLPFNLWKSHRSSIIISPNARRRRMDYHPFKIQDLKLSGIIQPPYKLQRDSALLSTSYVALNTLCSCHSPSLPIC